MAIRQKFGNPPDYVIGLLKGWQGAVLSDQNRIARLKKDYRIRINDLWEKKRPDWLSTPKTNFVINQVELFVAMMTESNPKYNLFARDVGNPMLGVNREEIARRFKGKLDYWWNKNKINRKLKEVLLNSIPYGTGVLKLNFNPAADDGFGEIEIKNCAPEKVRLDSDTESFADAKRVYYEDWVAIEDIKETYGVSMDAEETRAADFRKEARYVGGRLQTPVTTVSSSGAAGEDGVLTSTWSSEYKKKTVQWDPKYQKADQKKLMEGRVMLIECWWDDPTIETIPLTERQQEAVQEHELLLQGQPVDVKFNDDHRTHIEQHLLAVQGYLGEGEIPMDDMGFVEAIEQHVQTHLEYDSYGFGYEGHRKKYPKGRLTVLTRDGRVIYDGANPYGVNPFVVFYFIRLPNEPWGLGLIEIQEYNQMIHNRARAKQMDMINLGAAPPLLVPNASNLKIKEAVIKPWSVWPIAGDKLSAPFLLDVAGLTPMIQHIEGVLKSVEYNIDTQVSLHDAALGRVPTGIKSGRGIEALKEASFRRAGLPIQYMEEALEEVAFKVITMMQRFYTTAREFRILGDNQQSEYVDDFIPSEYKDINFDIEIETGSTLPKDEISQRQDFTQLVQVLGQMGIMMPLEAIFEVFDIPNKAKYLQQIQQQMMQQQQAQQQGAGNEGGLAPEEQQTLETSTNPEEIQAILAGGSNK